MDIPTPRILSPSMYVGRVRPIRGVMFHTGEGGLTPGRPTAAFDLATYFAGVGHYSCHRTIDSHSIYVCVEDANTAWCAPGANADFLHIELCTQCDVCDWNEASHIQMLAIAAKQAKEWCNLYNIPIVWLTPADMAAGKPGIADHKVATDAYPTLAAQWGSHHDCGANFDHNNMIALIQGVGSGVATIPAPPPPVDNTAYIVAILTAWINGPILKNGSFGSAVTLLQQRLNVHGANLTADGVEGPHTVAAVVAFQASHNLTADGLAGPMTKTALLH